jgi:antitoxin (DNA-binding transcriptional repressor) of toxin-antitoxin stability system
MFEVTVQDAQSRLPDLVNAAVEGEKVYIVGSPQHVVQLVPVESPKPRPKFGSAAGMISMRDDFDAPLEDFREYME